jgi:tetratricopeptide (TPR) repeat protein
VKHLIYLGAAVWLATTAAAQTPPAAAVEQRQAQAYYHFALGHLNQVAFDETGDQHYADAAVENYQKALELDPQSVAIRLFLAETLAQAQRLRDAVLQARTLVEQHPDNIEGHRLLARIYLRTLGELGPQARQRQTLALAIEQYEAVLKLAPSDSEAALWLARLYRYTDQPARALPVLEALLTRDPNNEEALAQYAELQLEQGHPEAVVGRLGPHEQELDSSRLLSLLGEAQTRTGHLAEAERAYAHAYRVDPQSPAVLARLAQTLFDEQKLTEAARAYQQLQQLNASDFEPYLRLAQIHYQQKQYDRAEQDIAQARQRAPDNLEVLYSEALIYRAQGRYGDATQPLLRAIELGQKAPEKNPRALAAFYELLGRLYREQQDLAAALDAFDRMAALGPQAARRARLERIETFRENNDLAGALSEARQALDADPADRQLKLTYALLLGEQQQTEQAVGLLRGMLDHTPADLDVYLSLAQVYERGRRYAEAEQAARAAEALARTPDDRTRAWFLLGAIYERQKKYDRAEKEFSRVLEVNPDDAPTLNYYGYMLAERGVRLAQAAELVRRALAQDANNGAYLDSLGWTYFRQNRLAEARQWLLKAVARSPHDPTILGHLGDVYQRLGQMEQAVRTWEKALEAWKHVAPADYEPDQVHELEKKLARSRARANAASTTPSDR